MKRLFVLIAAGLILPMNASFAVSPYPRDENTSFTANQRAEIAGIAVQYLLQHPELLLQMQTELQLTTPHSICMENNASQRIAASNTTPCILAENSVHPARR